MMAATVADIVRGRRKIFENVKKTGESLRTDGDNYLLVITGAIRNMKLIK